MLTILLKKFWKQILAVVAALTAVLSIYLKGRSDQKTKQVVEAYDNEHKAAEGDAEVDNLMSSVPDTYTVPKKNRKSRTAR